MQPSQLQPFEVAKTVFTYVTAHVHAHTCMYMYMYMYMYMCMC